MECSILILSTLRKCVYSEAFMAAHAKCNIINVLIEKLEMVIGSADIIDTKHVKRRKNYESAEYPIPSKRSKSGIGYSVEVKNFFVCFSALSLPLKSFLFRCPGIQSHPFQVMMT